MEATGGVSSWVHSSEDGLEDLREALDADGLRDDLVDLAGPRPLDIVILDVAGAGHDHGLRSVVGSVEVSDALSLFEAIHNGHADVREDEPVDVGAGFETSLDLL